MLLLSLSIQLFYFRFAVLLSNYYGFMVFKCHVLLHVHVCTCSHGIDICLSSTFMLIAFNFSKNTG